MQLNKERQYRPPRYRYGIQAKVLAFVPSVLPNPDLVFNFHADPDPLRLLAKHKAENFSFGSGSKDLQIRVTAPDSSKRYLEKLPS